MRVGRSTGEGGLLTITTKRPTLLGNVEEEASAVAEPSFVPLLIAVAKSTRALVGIALQDTDLLVGQDELVLALVDNKRMCVSEVADALAVRPATASKMIRRLEQKGFVERSTNGGDGRRVMVRLTASGREVRERVAAAHGGLAADLRKVLGRDVSAVSATLARLDKVLTGQLQRLR